MRQIETLEPTEVIEELDEMRFLDVWNNLGEQDFSMAAAQLPSGFGRYVLCLPAASPPQRQLSESPNTLTMGRR